jgi:hypothetical protein
VRALGLQRRALAVVGRVPPPGGSIWPIVRIAGDLDFPGIRFWGIKGFRRWVVFYGVRGDDLILFRVVSGTMNRYVLGFD